MAAAGISQGYFLADQMQTSVDFSGMKQAFVGKRVVLHVDVNKTIIAIDAAGGKNRKKMILDILADNTFARWGESLEKPISFHEYVWEHLHPGLRSDKELKQRRNGKVFHFIEYLKELSHPMLDTVLEKKRELEKQEDGIFPSFWKLLTDLKTQGIHYFVILRSFGSELDDVGRKIEQHEGIQFMFHGNFKDGRLYSREVPDEPLSAAATCEIFKSMHCIVQDTWKEWNQDEEKGRSGKRFYFDSSDSNAVSVFFDDNAEPVSPDERTIVCPVDAKTGEKASVADLFGKTVFKVSTFNAATKPHTFLSYLNQAAEVC